MPLSGGVRNLVEYLPITEEGTYKFRVEFDGNVKYKPYSYKGEVFLKDIRPYAVMNFAQGVVVNAILTDTMDYDYTGMEEKLFNAAYLGGEPDGLTAEQVTVTYKKTLDAKNYQDVPQEVTVFFRHTKDYRDTTVTFTATIADPRIATSFTLRNNPSATYNMDMEALKKAVITKAVNSGESAMPPYDTDRYIVEYKNEILGFDVWNDVRGETLADHLNAGDYTIRFRYTGNAEYRPTDYVETAFTVQKANVSVSIKSTVIESYAPLPAGYVTCSPADDFDVWTFFLGISLKLTTAAYVQLPESLTSNIAKIDPYYEALAGITLTEELQHGMTLSEFREVLNKLAEINETVENLPLIGFSLLPDDVSDIIDVITSLPGFMNNTSIAIGSPIHSGLYVVDAEAFNKNYNRGHAMSLQLVTPCRDGNELHWNTELPASMTLDEFKAADKTANITHNGRLITDSNAVEYRYYRPFKLFGLIELRLITGTPTSAGTYIQGAYTFGGDLTAKEITRSFTITG